MTAVGIEKSTLVAGSMHVGTAVGLFSGVGGLELGASSAGLRTALLCESDDRAASVLRCRFDGIPIASDVVALTKDDVRGADVLMGGFPCQDLSQAGRLAGITGSRSGLVQHMLRLVESGGPHTLLVENVPFMLALERGGAMAWLTQELERRGLDWAYRVVDAQAFGLPQRRRRVLLVASREIDPRGALLNEDTGRPPVGPVDGSAWCGFYWTEGNTGLGWAVDGVPPLKGGSGLGIPSAPAVWRPQDGRMLTPGIGDAEALQGFEPGWTHVERGGSARESVGARWRMVGNAVSVPVAEWVTRRIVAADPFDADAVCGPVGDRWPTAAWGGPGRPRTAVAVSDHPVRRERSSLADLLADPGYLSAKATRGFFGRLSRSRLTYPPRFLADGREHLAWMTAREA